MHRHAQSRPIRIRYLEWLSLKQKIRTLSVSERVCLIDSFTMIFLDHLALPTEYISGLISDQSKCKRLMLLLSSDCSVLGHAGAVKLGAPGNIVGFSMVNVVIMDDIHKLLVYYATINRVTISRLDNSNIYQRCC